MYKKSPIRNKIRPIKTLNLIRNDINIVGTFIKKKKKWLKLN